MSLGSEIRGDARPTVRLNGPSIFSSDSIPYLLAMSDALVILLSGLFGGIAYQAAIGNPATELLPYCAVGLLASFVYILRMSGAGHYDFPECARPRVEFNDILICWLTTGLLLAFFAFLLKVGVDYSRGAFVSFYFVAPIALLGVRRAMKGALASAVARGAFARRDIVLIGDADEVAALGAQDMLTLFGAVDVTRFTLSRDADPSRRASDDGRVLAAAVQFARGNRCQEIILALPWGATERIEFVRDAIKVLPVAARLLPDIRVRSLTSYASSARQRVVSIEVQRAPLSAAEQAAKRLMDIAVAVVALIVLLPVMILAAIAVKLDSPGPVIFRQRRKGFNGREFVMFKFRSMTVQEDGSVVAQAKRNDPRVTAIGKVLRASSIDELPQLVNVLRGDMSLIGPRPHALAHDNYFQNIVSDYAFRHHMKPGLTGWAQCNGSRGATPSVEHVSERVRLDLWYINNWSLWLDIQILFKTFFEVLRKRNAY